jgi:hypothetical protein
MYVSANEKAVSLKLHRYTVDDSQRNHQPVIRAQADGGAVLGESS